jgi:DNA-binding NtrC family response regulator
MMTSLVVVISPFTEDRVMLGDTLTPFALEIATFTTLKEASAALGRASVVVCDAVLPDGDWREVMTALETMADPALLIVASHLADNRLWAEVLNEGGHDVLAKPFRAEEVLRCVVSACRWRGSRGAGTQEMKRRGAS